jgi:hypothetical protein
MQEFTTQARCEKARDALIAKVDRMNKSNLTGGVPRRELLSADCLPK